MEPSHPKGAWYIQARWAVSIGIATALAGSIVGLVFGVFPGTVSGPESWLIVSCALVSTILLVLLIRRPGDATARISALASLYFSIHLCTSIAIAMLNSGELLQVLPYLLWFYPLLTFNKFTNFGRHSGQIDWLITLAPPALFLIFAGKIANQFQITQIANLAVFLLSFLSYAFFLNLFSRYRESAAIGAARAQELERANKVVRESEDRYRRLFDSSHTGMGTLDSAGRIQWANPAFVSMVGGQALVQDHLFVTCLHPEDRDRWQADMSAMIDAEEAVFSFEGRLAPKQGRSLHVEGSFVRTPESGSVPEAVTFVCQDVTERREFGVRLLQSQKLEAVGQLTGGIAHDFNNLLTVILGNASTIEEVSTERVPKMLAQLTRTAAERGAALTNRLLSFSRRQPLDTKPADVNRLLAGMDDLLRRSLGARVDITMAPAEGLWPALIDTSQLENAVLNLCINARDAMPLGGRLTIETANIDLDDDYADHHVEVAAGPYVMIVVSDTGSGMDEETLSHAFEPFFTTKDVGKGSGLGLSMVYGFVRQSQGHVQVYSELGQGTTFKLYLPRSLVEADAPVRETDGLPLAGGNERILLVEDDDMVRAHALGQLRSLGYQVVAVRDGSAAVATLKEPGRFDLLFTDVIMPGGMDGAQLAKEARGLRPSLPVLFTSGYTENAILHQARLRQDENLLNKPYRLQDLAGKVRIALDR